MLKRIRDIRASKKVFYRQVLEICATSIDYDSQAEISICFFKKVQNKIHYAIHGQTAAEVIYTRADAEKVIIYNVIGLYKFIFKAASRKRGAYSSYRFSLVSNVVYNS